MQKELNSLDLEVKRMMLEYPSLFPSRLECLETLFCTNGTGYGWKDGVLVNPEDVGKPMPTKIDAATPYDHSADEDGNLEESEVIRLEYEGVMRGFIEKNIDYLCQDYHHTGTKMNFTKVYPMSWDYCNMAKASLAPHTIDPAWRNGIREFIYWYLAEVNGKFGCYSDPDRTTENPDTSRLDQQTLENYTICRRVLKDINTDADKMKSWLMRKDMKKMLHEVMSEDKIDE